MKIYRINPLKEIFWSNQTLTKPFFKTESDFDDFLAEYFIQIVDTKLKIENFEANDINIVLSSEDYLQKERNFPQVIAVDLNNDKNYRFYNYSTHMHYLDNKNIRGKYYLDIWLTYVMQLSIIGNANVIQAHLDPSNQENQEIIKYQDFGELNYIVKDTRELIINTGNIMVDNFINRGWYLFFLKGEQAQSDSNNYYANTSGPMISNELNYWRYPYQVIAIPAESNVYIDTEFNDKYQLENFYSVLLASGNEKIENIVLVNYLPVVNINTPGALKLDSETRLYYLEKNQYFYNFIYKTTPNIYGLEKSFFLTMENWNNENQFMFPIELKQSIIDISAIYLIDVDTIGIHWEPSNIVFVYEQLSESEHEQGMVDELYKKVGKEYFVMTGNSLEEDGITYYNTKETGESVYNNSLPARINGIVYPIYNEVKTTFRYGAMVYTGKSKKYILNLSNYFDESLVMVVLNIEYQYFKEDESEETWYNSYIFNSNYLEREFNEHFKFTNYTLNYFGRKSRLIGNSYITIVKKIGQPFITFYTQTHVDASSKKNPCQTNDLNDLNEWNNGFYGKGYILRVRLKKYQKNDLKIVTNYPYTLNEYRKDNNYIKKALTKIQISKHNLIPIELDISKLNNDFIKNIKIKSLVDNMLPGEEFYIENKNYSTEPYRNNILLFTQLNDLPYTSYDDDEYKVTNKPSLIKNSVVTPVLKSMINVAKISSYVEEERYFKAARESIKLGRESLRYGIKSYNSVSDRNNKKLIIDNTENNNSNYLYNAFYSMQSSGYNLVLQQPIDSQYHSIYNYIKNFGYQTNKLLYINNDFLKTREFFNYIKISNSSEVIVSNMSEESLSYFAEIFSSGVKLVHYKPKSKRFFPTTNKNIL